MFDRQCLDSCLTQKQVQELTGVQLNLDLDPGLDLSDPDTINLESSISILDFDTMISSGAGAQPTLTIDTSIWNNDAAWTISDNGFSSPVWPGKIELQGDDADIEINGESVVGMLREIRDRLNILQVSEQMEKEWDELRELRERYQAKLAECEEKSRAWKALQQMPPPKID